MFKMIVPLFHKISSFKKNNKKQLIQSKKITEFLIETLDMLMFEC